MSKLKELANLVKKMRDAQTQYFKSRTTAKLEAAFQLEKLVDLMVEDVLDDDLFTPKKDDGSKT